MAGNWLELPSHLAWLEREAERILTFATRSVVPNGFGWLGVDGRPDASRPLELWVTARMTHVFALGHLAGRPGLGLLVDHGLAAVRRTFADIEHGGWRSTGGDDATRKEAYPQLFVLLAAASATVAGRPEGAQLLDDAAEVIERRFWSKAEGACSESYAGDWTDPEPYRGANANMHAVEVFLAVGDATGDPKWAARALRIAERLMHRVARAHDWRVVEHFGADWRPLPDFNADAPADPFRPFGVTPGHALEWSRLLVCLGAALPDPPEWLLPAAEALFGRAVRDGWREPGGFVYTTDPDGEPVVSDRFHWAAAEAIAAAATLFAATGEEAYLQDYRRFWDFTERRLLDYEAGSWHHELDERLEPGARTWSGKPDAYHAYQATLIPRLPLAPSLAGALRDGRLAS